MPIKVITVPQLNIKMAIQCEGFIFFKMMLLGTSSSVYGMKKIVTAVLYCSVLEGMFKSVVMPAIFAFPTFQS